MCVCRACAYTRVRTHIRFEEEKEYICNECSSDIELQKHQPGGCGMCDDLDHLPVDIIDCVNRVEKFAGNPNLNINPNPSLKLTSHLTL